MYFNLHHGMVKFFKLCIYWHWLHQVIIFIKKLLILSWLISPVYLILPFSSSLWSCVRIVKLANRAYIRTNKKDTHTSKTSEPLRVLTINFQSIKNKKPEVELIIESCKPSIIFGTETWLSNDTSPYEYIPSSKYSIYTKNRKDAMGEYYWLSQTSWHPHKSQKQVPI